MYTIIICALLAFVSINIIWIKDVGLDWGMFFLSFPISLLGAIGGAVIAFALPTNHKIIIWSEEIVSLKDNLSIHGNFYFLGGGYINGTMQYVYYYKTGSGIRMRQIDFDRAEIKYSSKTPTATITTNYLDKESLWNKFAIDFERDDDYSVVLQIPEGSIKSNYELDAQ